MIFVTERDCITHEVDQHYYVINAILQLQTFLIPSRYTHLAWQQHEKIRGEINKMKQRFVKRELSYVNFRNIMTMIMPGSSGQYWQM